MSMTRDEILNMPAGREMDALIATKIMGWKVDDLTATSPTGSSNARIPHGDEWLEYYSTDIAAAFGVMEKMGIALIPQSTEFGFRWYACDIEKVVYGESVDVYEKNESGVSEESAPLAICRAALLAVQSASPTHDSS